MNQYDLPLLGEYCKTRIFSVNKFLSKHCQRAFSTSIFRECVTVKNINKSINIKMLLEMQLPHEWWGNQLSCLSNYSATIQGDSYSHLSKYLVVN